LEQKVEDEIEWGSLSAAVGKDEGERVVAMSYGWTISVDGSVSGLIAGDHGYEFTHIVIPREHILALFEYWLEVKAKNKG